jgi:hypothetical protein
MAMPLLMQQMYPMPVVPIAYTQIPQPIPVAIPTPVVQEKPVYEVQKSTLNPEKKAKIIKTIAQLMDTYKGKKEDAKMNNMFNANAKSNESLKDKLIKSGIIKKNA